MLLGRFSIVLGFVIVGCSSVVPRQATVVNYEPTTTLLSGVLVLEMKYGPPNFGEDPATDAQVQVPVLRLDVPIDIIGNPASELNSDTLREVKEIQLVLRMPLSELRRFVGHSVTATGTLSRAITGHHYTAALLAVESIRR